MRMGATVVAGIATLALGGAVATPVASGRAKLRACADIQLQRKHSTLLATRIRTDYGCSYARSKLQGLLSKGVGGIPSSKAHSGRWGCRLGAVAWTCRRYLRAGGQTKRIGFVLTVQVGGDSTPPPPVPPPPPPPLPTSNPLQRCVDLWNGDPVNRALLGYHFYYHHLIRRFWVYQLPSGRCAFIGVVPASDLEYGNDGEVSVPGGGWAFIADVPELGDPKVVQSQAPANANATLSGDESVKLD
jgi:hypothetical protein